MTGARLLFLDDSGKPDANHASKAVVVGGFAIDADLYPTLSRRVLGAKASHFAKRGQPQAWELKSSMLVKPNPWKRATNRRFCDEVARILGSVGATVFSTTLDKSRLKHPMALTTSMPLQLQSLVEHFDVECKAMSRVGMVFPTGPTTFWTSMRVNASPVSRPPSALPCTPLCTTHPAKPAKAYKSLTSSPRYNDESRKGTPRWKHCPRDCMPPVRLTAGSPSRGDRSPTES